MYAWNLMMGEVQWPAYVMSVMMKLELKWEMRVVGYKLMRAVGWNSLLDEVLDIVRTGHYTALAELDTPDPL
jgi:hypothetical protein